MSDMAKSGKPDHDRTKGCKYHRNNDHSNEDCLQQKSEAKSGNLDNGRKSGVIITTVEVTRGTNVITRQEMVNVRKFVLLTVIVKKTQNVHCRQYRAGFDWKSCCCDSKIENKCMESGDESYSSRGIL